MGRRAEDVGMTSKSQLLRCWLEILSLGGPTSGGEDLVRHSNFLIQWGFQHQDILPLNSANHLGDLSENQCTPWTRAYASAPPVPPCHTAANSYFYEIFTQKTVTSHNLHSVEVLFNLARASEFTWSYTFCPKGFRMIQGFVWAYDLGLI